MKVLTQIGHDLEEFQSDLHQDQRALREEVARMAGSADQLVALVRKVLEAGPGQAPGPAYRMTAQHAALEDDAAEAAEAAQGEDDSFWKKIRKALHRVGRYLWRMISQLLKVKEWSLTGGVDTGMLGLANVSISVTFG